ncbi:MAG TPA: hypothetical protein VIM30_07065, partial [Candidatus Limnocylindrales bacterium]
MTEASNGTPDGGRTNGPGVNPDAETETLAVPQSEVELEPDEGDFDDEEAADEAAGDEEEEGEAPPRVAPARPGRRGREFRPARAAAAAPTPSETAVHVSDRWSSAFVTATVAVFAIIFLNGLLFGHGGFLRPLPSPT